jgi:hypothetical protein
MKQIPGADADAAETARVLLGLSTKQSRRTSMLLQCRRTYNCCGEYVMSKVVIQGNASGTGDFTIAAPNSNTDRTLTLPDELEKF